jgi:hypothetical protein
VAVGGGGERDVAVLVAERDAELHDGHVVDVCLDERVPLARPRSQARRGRAVDGAARVLCVDGDERVRREQGGDGVQL